MNGRKGAAKTVSDAARRWGRLLLAGTKEESGIGVVSCSMKPVPDSEVDILWP